MCGVYPDVGVATAGDEISSTYEGRHITMREDELIHPMLAVPTGFVVKGDPVIICLAATPATYGKAVGVAFNTATATSDMIAVDTEGIWALDVWSYTDGAVGSAVNPGDELFIHDDSLSQVAALGLGDAVISKIRNVATQIPFGYALGYIAGGTHGVIAVKVHFDPSLDTEEVKYNTVTPGQYGEAMYCTMALAASEGICKLFSSTLSGQQAGLTYNLGSWINLGGTFIATGTVTTTFDTGIYSGAGANLAAARLIFGAQHMAILDSIPNQYYPWRINVSAGAGSITALIQAGNIQSVGYIAAITETADPIGYIPLAFIAGIAAAQPCYVRVYADTT